MNRLFATLAVTVIGVVWLVTFKVTPIETEAVGGSASPSPISRAPAPFGAPATRTGAPTAAVGAPATNGSYTGSAVRTIYGDVQVRIIVSGQKVTDVQAVVLPQDRARSARISQYSAPILRTEAIRAQSATIDIVSGATYTSVAYGRSLDSALKQAHLG